MAKKIVLVDDSATVLMTVQMALEELVESGDIELAVYQNPVLALEDMKNGLIYDLCVTDINMPQMSGFELVKSLKTIETVARKPIIALTTENSPQMKAEGKKIGLAGWLTKPFTNEKLLMAIKRILRLK
ncbi:MAG: response regulator [Campylobacterota bacterium]|nr:response regulator [Campylobacterota bacterium]